MIVVQAIPQEQVKMPPTFKIVHFWHLEGVITLCHSPIPATLDASDAGDKASKETGATTAEKGQTGQTDVTPPQAVGHW